MFYCSNKKLNFHLSRNSPCESCEEVGNVKNDVEAINVKKGSKGKYRAVGTKLNKTAADEPNCQTEINNGIFSLRSQYFISMKLMEYSAYGIFSLWNIQLMEYSASMDDQLTSMGKNLQERFLKTSVTAEAEQKSLQKRRRKPSDNASHDCAKRQLRSSKKCESD